MKKVLIVDDDIAVTNYLMVFLMQTELYESTVVNDSRDIEPDEWLEEFPDDYIDEFDGDPIYLPDIPLNVMKRFSGSYLVGGGRNECLAEVEILMSVFNIKAKKVRKFIY